MKQSSGTAVLDKAVLLMEAVAPGPLPLADLVEATGLPRATAYRLAVAMESLRLMARDESGRWQLGTRIAELSAHSPDPLVVAAAPALRTLVATTQESAQVYRREGPVRVCVASVERATGLRDTVPVGARLPMTAGSAARVLLAWLAPTDRAALVAETQISDADLALVRERGWASSVAEREPGVASVSAPVFAGSGEVVAAVSVSGPISRLGDHPGEAYVPALVDAAQAMAVALP